MSEYYKLPNNKRWLPDIDTPSEIGGRATDVSQIAVSLLSIFLSKFSKLNDDSIGVTVKIARLNNLLSDGELLIQEIIDDISVMTREAVD